MCKFQEFRTDIIGHVGDIAAAFNVATSKDPWLHLPEPERINFLRNLIQPMAELALSDHPDPILCRRALHMAARHGERRHEQGMSDTVLFDDVYYFRQAICSQLDYRREPELYGEAIRRLDSLLTLICLASLRGYYRDDFEAKGAWPDTLDELGAEMTSYLQ